jgi:hypothetical protein
MKNGLKAAGDADDAEENFAVCLVTATRNQL